MKCQKCKHEMSDNDIRTDEVNDQIDLQWECGNCGANHYFFIDTDNLTSE